MTDRSPHGASHRRPAPPSERPVPPSARWIAAHLVKLFERDHELVAALNATQDRLLAANARLWDGLHPDALGPLYDERLPAAVVLADFSARSSVVPMEDGDPLDRAEVLAAVQSIHWTIHRAFLDHQRAADERRQLAFDVGEACAELVAAMTGAGFTKHEATSADVHALAEGHYRPTREDR